MNVTYRCPKCEQAQRCDVDEASTEIDCAACGQSLRIPSTAIEGETIRRCLACPSTDLYVRKDFPQRIGVGIVVAGFIASSIAWYGYHLYWTFGLLFATALIDVALYALVGDALMCYRCGALYRGFEHGDEHGRFDLDTHERHRQQVERMKQFEKAASPD